MFSHILGMLHSSALFWMKTAVVPLHAVLSSWLCRSLLYQATQGIWAEQAKLELADLISSKQHTHECISEKNWVPDCRKHWSLSGITQLCSNSLSLCLRHWFFTVKVLHFYRIISNMSLKYYEGVNSKYRYMMGRGRDMLVPKEMEIPVQYWEGGVLFLVVENL